MDSTYKLREFYKLVQSIGAIKTAQFQRNKYSHCKMVFYLT